MCGKWWNLGKNILSKTLWWHGINQGKISSQKGHYISTTTTLSLSTLLDFLYMIDHFYLYFMFGFRVIINLKTSFHSTWRILFAWIFICLYCLDFFFFCDMVLLSRDGCHEPCSVDQAHLQLMHAFVFKVLGLKVWATMLGYSEHSFQGWMRQPKSRKRVPRPGRVIESPLSLLKVPQEYHTVVV